MLRRDCSSSVAEPVDDIVLASPGVRRAASNEWSPWRRVGDPIHVGSPVKQQLRRPSLAGGASVPKSLRQCFAFGAGLTTEQLFEAIEHAKGGRMPELVYVGTFLAARGGAGRPCQHA